MTALLDLNHLAPWAREIATLNDKERIKRIRLVRWIGYTKAEEVINKLEELITHPRCQRMPNLLLTGATNNGKTMIINKFCRQHAIKKNDQPSKPDIEKPIVAIQMPPYPKSARFYSALLYGLDTKLSARRPIADLEMLVIKTMERLHVKLLIIDEVHNLLSGKETVQEEFFNILRYLGNSLSISIVCVGTKEAHTILRSDDQLENRFESLTLPLWKNDDELASLIMSLLSTLPLKQPSSLTASELLRFIHEKSEGTIGEMVSLLKKSAILAIRTGEEMINKNILSKVVYFSPKERRQNLERNLREY